MSLPWVTGAVSMKEEDVLQKATTSNHTEDKWSNGPHSQDWIKYPSHKD